MKDVATPLIEIPSFSHEFPVLDTQYYEWKTIASIVTIKFPANADFYF